MECWWAVAAFTGFWSLNAGRVGVVCWAGAGCRLQPVKASGFLTAMGLAMEWVGLLWGDGGGG